MDHSDIVDQWRDSISLSNGELGDATIGCFIVDGMEMIRDGDSTTQITFAMVTTFEYDSAVTHSRSLSEQPLPTDGSISWLAPAHPVALNAGDGLVGQTIPLWWNNVDIVIGSIGKSKSKNQLSSRVRLTGQCTQSLSSSILEF